MWHNRLFSFSFFFIHFSLNDAQVGGINQLNAFNNDGSFLENFKKISEQVQQQLKQQSPVVSVPEALENDDTNAEMAVVECPAPPPPPGFMSNVYSSPPPSIHPPAFTSNVSSINLFTMNMPPPPNSQLPSAPIKFPIVTSEEPTVQLIPPELDIRNAKGGLFKWKTDSHVYLLGNFFTFFFLLCVVLYCWWNFI